MLKYKYIFQIKYTEAMLSNSTRKLLWFEITKMLIACSFKNKFIVSFIIFFRSLLRGTPLFYFVERRNAIPHVDVKGERLLLHENKSAKLLPRVAIFEL